MIVDLFVYIIIKTIHNTYNTTITLFVYVHVYIYLIFGFISLLFFFVYFLNNFPFALLPLVSACSGSCRELDERCIGWDASRQSLWNKKSYFRLWHWPRNSKVCTYAHRLYSTHIHIYMKTTGIHAYANTREAIRKRSNCCYNQFRCFMVCHE